MTKPKKKPTQIIDVVPTAVEELPILSTEKLAKKLGSGSMTVKYIVEAPINWFFKEPDVEGNQYIGFEVKDPDHALRLTRMAAAENKSYDEFIHTCIQQHIINQSSQEEAPVELTPEVLP